MHDPLRISRAAHLTGFLLKAYHQMKGKKPAVFFWQFFSTQCHLIRQAYLSSVLGPGDDRLAKMRYELCSVARIQEACLAYAAMIAVV